MTQTRERIIVVDDIATNLSIAKSALSDKYDVFTAPSGAKLMLLLNKLTPDLILLDIEMPEMDGYEVIKVLKNSEKTMNIPVIFLTGKIDPEHEVRGLSLGAVDYITKPFSRELLLKRIDLHVLFERQKQELLNHNLRLENEVDKKTKTVMELQSTILKAVAELVESRDNVTGDHIGRTQKSLNILIDLLISNDIYKEELAELDIPLLVMSSQLHDVGKISIRDNILMKQGKLDYDEFEEMKKHTVYGVDIIRKIEDSTSDNDFLHYAEVYAGTHHERWDGTGYPHGLKEMDIPIHGRLMAIVDVYDALVSKRPYKNPFPHSDAIDIISKGLGTQFDPVICKVFIDNHKSFENIDGSGSFMSGGYGNLNPTMKTIVNGVGKRSGSEYGHTEKMQRYLEVLFDATAEHEILKNETSLWDKEIFLMSAILHDVGELSVSDQIFTKIEDLTPDEFSEFISHTNFGVKVVQSLKGSIDHKNILHHAEMFTGSHHEKWDGTGYPLGLKGRGIPLEGRMMAVVDVYDALTTDRPHRKRKTHKEAVQLIKNGSGTHFDPDIVGIFLDNEAKFEKISDL
ncbi:MAG: response regulator [Oscillospiraceae bacterium]|jgi:putative two-component system response regulator|nr:response regulator [Oscillospiraceae bacterium]